MRCTPCRVPMLESVLLGDKMKAHAHAVNGCSRKGNKIYRFVLYRPIVINIRPSLIQTGASS